MKLSKKNAARQRVLQKAIASGKTLGGLLVGLTAATVVGGCKDPSPASTMGSYPRPQQQANATSENIGEFVTRGLFTEPKPKTPQPKPNAVRERRGKEIVLGGKPLSPPPLPQGQYRVKYGDTLSKIAKAHGTTVAELKRLNGFDDVRANNLIMGEIIQVPQPKPNAVRERRDNEIVLSGDVPSRLEAQLTFRTAGVIMSQLLPTNKTPKVHLNKGNSKKLKGNSKENDVKVEVDL